MQVDIEEALLQCQPFKFNGWAPNIAFQVIFQNSDVTNGPVAFIPAGAKKNMCVSYYMRFQIRVGR